MILELKWMCEVDDTMSMSIYSFSCQSMLGEMLREIVVLIACDIRVSMI